MRVKDLIKSLEQTGLNNEVRLISKDKNEENIYLSFDDVGDVLIYPNGN